MKEMVRARPLKGAAPCKPEIYVRRNWDVEISGAWHATAALIIATVSFFIGYFVCLAQGVIE